MAKIDDDLEMFDTLIETGPPTGEELMRYEPKLPKVIREKEDEDIFQFFDDEDLDDMVDLFDPILVDEPKPKEKSVRVKEKKEKMPERIIGITPEMRIFLGQYMRTGTITTALKYSKIPLARYKKWLEKSPMFAQAVADSTDALADRLESEAFKQALSGNTKVLLKALEAMRPGKWGKSSTVNSFIEGKMQVEITDWSSLVKKAEVVDVTPKRIEGE